jgi:hypothetical protein
MAAGLGICVDKDRGDLDEVLRLRAEIKRLREERLTFCTVEGYPGKFGTKPLSPGPEPKEPNRE